MADATLAGSTVGKASAAPLAGTDVLRIVRSNVSYKGTLADVATYMATAMAALAVSATTIELGHASDTTISRVSAGRIAVEGSNVIMASDIGVTVQAYDADLASWASVTRASGFDTFTATPSSTNLRALLTDETGTGSAVFATSPTLVTPLLGTPTSGTLTNCTGLPVATGISGLATGIATFLATPTSANLAAAITNETGSGSLVFATSPTLVTPNLGTPSAGVLTNCTGLPNASVVGLGTAALVADNTLVHLSGSETITGIKTVAGASPEWRFNETDAGTDAKEWATFINAGVEYKYLVNDARSVFTPVYTITRTGVASSIFNFGSTTTVQVNGDPVMTRGATETVTGPKTFSSAVSLTANPASSFQIDFTNSTKITVANGSSATLGPAGGFSGIVILHDDADGGAAVYLCSAGTSFKLGGQTKYVAATSSPGAGEVSVNYDSSANYRIYNNQGSSRTFWVSMMRTRNAV